MEVDAKVRNQLLDELAMRSRGVVPSVIHRVAAALLTFLSLNSLSVGQTAPGRQPVAGNQNQFRQAATGEPARSSGEAEDELQKGTALARAGSFADAIPHLLAAQGRVSNEYAASFNLALCYVGIREFKPAIGILQDLRGRAHDGADVENLLAQAYIGNAQPSKALASLQKAAAFSPQNEKLYLLIADACMDHQDYALGLKAVDIGLQNLPQSPRLHYQRGMFLSQLDEFDRAKADFELTNKLAPGSEIGYLSAAEEALLSGKIPEAIRVAREGIGEGFQNPTLLTILGEALFRSGAIPGEPEFVEAQTALEKSVAQQPNDSSSQIALGRMYLIAGRLNEAIAHLEKARHIQPGSASVYASLAKAYQRRGDAQEAQAALAILEKLNRAQAERINSAPGDRKVSYGGRGEHDVPDHQ